jgi:hypothetical protein
MSEYPSTPDDYVAASYRYLRLAIVVLVVTLGVSLGLERAFNAHCLQGSISAYYYTPVHSIFVGVLLAIGVSLVALKGRDTVEDMFFNLAGVLAPVVALVPTERPGTICSDDDVSVPVTELVTNNVLSLLIGAGIAIGVAYAIAKLQKKVDVQRPSRAQVVGFALSLVLLAIGVWWFHAERANFEKYAHGSTAIAMFVAIWCAVMVNAGWPRKLLAWLYRRLCEDPPPPPTARQLRYRAWYRGVAIAMAAAGAAAALSLLIEFDNRVFWLEAFEIAPFALFWTLQTLEAWERGITDVQQ